MGEDRGRDRDRACGGVCWEGWPCLAGSARRGMEQGSSTYVTRTPSTQHLLVRGFFPEHPGDGRQGGGGGGKGEIREVRGMGRQREAGEDRGGRGSRRRWGEAGEGRGRQVGAGEGRGGRWRQGK